MVTFEEIMRQVEYANTAIMVRHCGGASIAEAKAAIKNHPNCILSLYPDENDSTKTVHVATKEWWKSNKPVVGIEMKGSKAVHNYFKKGYNAQNRRKRN